MVERCCARARQAAAELAQTQGVEILNDVVLNQVLFRVPAGPAAVMERVQREGTCWLGGTTWRGAPAIRFSVSNWSTTAADISRSVASITRAIEAARAQNG
jgi:glutamate/tyrosine decarboxylase-like PLP-dependent enzyme